MSSVAALPISLQPPEKPAHDTCTPPVFVSLLIAALVMWRVYTRVRRMVSRQRFTPWRAWLSIGLFSLISIVFVAVSVTHPLSLTALIGGLAVGVVLGIYSLRLTVFEDTPQGLYYTPSKHIGIGVAVLFVGRIVYRIVQMSFASHAAAPSSGLSQSLQPLTLLSYGLLAGYYVVYESGLVCHSRLARGLSTG